MSPLVFFFSVFFLGVGSICFVIVTDFVVGVANATLISWRTSWIFVRFFAASMCGFDLVDRQSYLSLLKC